MPHGKEVWTHVRRASNKLITIAHQLLGKQDHTDRRLLFASDNFLQALDARTGESILSSALMAV